MAPASDPGHHRPPPVGISDAAERAGVSARALRYYQQLGLIHPVCTSGGFRRYSDHDLERVARIRKLQALLGLDLDQIAVLLRHEDRLAEIRADYHDASTSTARRRELVQDSLTSHTELRATVAAKRAALDTFLADLDEQIARVRDAMTLLHPAESDRGASRHDLRI